VLVEERMDGYRFTGGFDGRETGPGLVAGTEVDFADIRFAGLEDDRLEYVPVVEPPFRDHCIIVAFGISEDHRNHSIGVKLVADFDFRALFYGAGLVNTR